MTATKTIKHVELIRKVETLKCGQWWVWECEVDYEDGTSAEGFIQSDEHMHALETFEVA